MVGSSSISTSPALTVCAVLHMDRAHHAGLERLDHLGPAGRDDLARRRGDDVDLAEAGPDERDARRTRHDGGGDGAAHRRGRRLDDLQRRRQEFELGARAGAPRRCGRATWRRVGSAGFMETRLQAMERGVAAAGADQLVVGAVLDEPAALDGEDAVGAAHGGQAVGDDQHRAALGDLRACSPG